MPVNRPKLSEVLVPLFRESCSPLRAYKAQKYAVQIRALLTFRNRRAWTFHILAEDQETLLVPDRSVGKRETLLSILSRIHGDISGAKSQDQGSVWIEITDAQVAALRGHRSHNYNSIPHGI